MNKRRIAILPLLLISVIPMLSGAEPAWILLEKGKIAFENREMTQALDTLLDAVELNSEYPEAEYWLGKVYEAQGQAVLAEEQYRRAIELSLYLRVPDNQIVFQYSLASLLLAQGEIRSLEAEAILHSLTDNEGASEPASISMDHKYLDIVTTTGLDDLLYLYRNELSSSLKARRILGEKAWNEGRYRTSLLESTRVVLSLLSSAAESYREKEPRWRFDIDVEVDEDQPDRDVRYPSSTDGVIALLNLIEQDLPYIAAWMVSEGFWPQLYLLGTSLYAEGYVYAAVSVWRILVTHDSIDGSFSARPGSGTWGRLAVRQLEEPFISKGSLAP